MTKKHNQFVNRKTRSLGSGGMDTIDKNRVRTLLEDAQITDILYDQYLVINRINHSYYIDSSISNEQAQALTHHKIRHPDIIFQMNRRPHIIEIDGAYHKDLDYDRDYEAIEIPYLKLNKWYLNKERISWAKWIYDWLDTLKT